MALFVFMLFLPIRGQAAFVFPFAKEAAAQTSIELEKPNAQTVNLLESFSVPTSEETGVEPVLIDSDGLFMPTVGPMGTNFDISETGPFDGQISVYIVKEGDTLEAIAKMFGVSKNTIVWANDLESEKLKIGDSLIILPITGVRYEIKKGDTLETIAKKFGGDVAEIRRFNGLPPDAKLTVGEFLIIPNGDMHLASTKPVVKPKAPASVKNVPLGYYIRPIASEFRWRKSQGYHGPYNAIDIAAPTGTPLLAAAAGTIIRAKDSGWNGGYGKMVVIAHDNGTQTLYAHLNSVVVSVGEKVAQGQMIGTVGSTGRSTGPHLHFEIRGVNARSILSAMY